MNLHKDVQNEEWFIGSNWKIFCSVQCQLAHTEIFLDWRGFWHILGPNKDIADHESSSFLITSSSSSSPLSHHHDDIWSRSELVNVVAKFLRDLIYSWISDAWISKSELHSQAGNWLVHWKHAISSGWTVRWRFPKQRFILCYCCLSPMGQKWFSWDQSIEIFGPPKILLGAANLVPQVTLRDPQMAKYPVLAITLGLSSFFDSRTTSSSGSFLSATLVILASFFLYWLNCMLHSSKFFF